MNLKSIIYNRLIESCDSLEFGYNVYVLPNGTVARITSSRVHGTTVETFPDMRKYLEVRDLIPA